MRSEKEMLELILGIAGEEERIRGVYMNGSRTNPNVPKDIFQDYDVVYVVTDTRPYREDVHWIDRFGERLYMQKPEQMDLDRGMDVDVEGCYGWLIQFADGNRLDLHVETWEKSSFFEDKLCRVLLDKDGRLCPAGESTDRDYWVKRPTQAVFYATCNEFWWCTNNLAKGLWRREIPYVQDMLNGYVRPQLVRLLEWKAGVRMDFTISCGKSGKYLYRYLPDSDWQRFLDTYCGREPEEIWQAVFTMCGLFLELEKEVGDALGFSYDEKEAENARAYLEHVHDLPEDAKEVYDTK